MENHTVWRLCSDRFECITRHNSSIKIWLIADSHLPPSQPQLPLIQLPSPLHPNLLQPHLLSLVGPLVHWQVSLILRKPRGQPLPSPRLTSRLVELVSLSSSLPHLRWNFCYNLLIQKITMYLNVIDRLDLTCFILCRIFTVTPSAYLPWPNMAWFENLDESNFWNMIKDVLKLYIENVINQKYYLGVKLDLNTKNLFDQTLALWCCDGCLI